MPDWSGSVIPPPADWQDFERLCWRLWKRIWKDPNAQRHGRAGQAQCGVDIFGQPEGSSRWVGIQCKAIDGRYGDVIEPDKLRAEVLKAKAFEPRLSQYIFATTAKTDAHIQKVVRELTEEHRKANLFSVHIYGWDDIVGLLSEHGDDLIRELLYLPPGERLVTENRGSVAEIDGRGSLSNVAIRVPLTYVNQQVQLEVVRAAFEKGRGRSAVVAIHGMRGVGKTTLAAVYAQEQGQQYRITWWLHSESEDLLRADLLTLGISAGWTHPTDRDEQAIDTVRARLRSEDQILLIYDSAPNADYILPYLPETGSVHVLITSNSRFWREIATPIELDPWPEVIGGAYLITRSGQGGSAEVAQALSAELGGLPLALATVAKVCERKEETLKAFLARLRASSKKVFQDSFADKDYAPVDYYGGTPIVKAFSLAIDAATAERGAARTMMTLAAQFPVMSIPIYVLAQAVAAVEGPVVATTQPTEVAKVIEVLRAFSLAARETLTDPNNLDRETEAIRLHSVVREIAYGRERDLQPQARRVLIKVLNSLYTMSIASDARHWHTARVLDPLAFALLTDEAQEVEAAQTPEMIELSYTAAGFRLSSAAKYAEAKPLLERVAAYRERILGPNDLATLSAQTNLAFCTRAMGEFVAASTLHEKLIEIRSLVQGPTHEETLHEVNLLSFALLRLSQHDRLETRLREHIARCEQSVGAKNLETFYARQNLALCLSAKGDLVGAEEEHRKTYSGLLAMNSPRSGAVLEAELNWCESLIALKRYNQARPLVEQAYEIATDIYGADFEVTRSARRLLDLLNGVDSERQ